jgi:hypothetical protein
MKAKTNKLRRLENNRTSILTDDLESCYICGCPADDMHEIYGGRNRRISMENGFCVPLCRYHHRVVTNNYEADLKLKQVCQLHFEKENSREDWFALIGKNYLEV